VKNKYMYNIFIKILAIIIVCTPLLLISYFYKLIAGLCGIYIPLWFSLLQLILSIFIIITVWVCFLVVTRKRLLKVREPLPDRYKWN